MSEGSKGNRPESGTEIAIVDEWTIRNRIYIVRGVKVMLDFELAEIFRIRNQEFQSAVEKQRFKV